jgi:hypothetical protein
MPRIPSGSSSRSSSSRSSRSSRKSKSNRKSTATKPKPRKTVKKSTFRRELKGKNLPKGQITDIIEFQKRSDATIPPYQPRPDHEYERMSEILENLRFDRDENLMNITTFGIATSKATRASKIEAGLRV